MAFELSPSKKEGAPNSKPKSLNPLKKCNKKYTFCHNYKQNKILGKPLLKKIIFPMEFSIVWGGVPFIPQTKNSFLNTTKTVQINIRMH